MSVCLLGLHGLPGGCIYMTWVRARPFMIETAGAAELLLNSAFSLHLSQRRAPLSCPRAKVWLRRNRHSLTDLAMEEGLEMAVDALNAVSRLANAAPTTSLAVFVLLLVVGGVVALGKRR